MRRPTISARNQRHKLTVILPALIVGVVGVTLWLSACAPNEPFDPLSVENKAPVVRMSVEPVNPGQELQPTSYYSRQFSWYGSDQDGWVEEYFVSIRTQRDVPAPWISTTQTDTTMSFETDANGNAEATFYLVCRDDRGALSDTLVKYIPLRNSPPQVEFQSDFEPLRNMQREITMPGTASADTTYWNWGSGFFRFFAMDPDGAATMDTFYQYTFAVPDPTESYEQGDPLADPLTTWVRVPFENRDEIKEFELFVSGAQPGVTRLTILVADEAGADDRKTYEWEVRVPQSNVLYIPDNSSTINKDLYFTLMDERFGVDSWDLYDFWFGFPEHPFVLLESMRLFDAVIWTGGTTSATLTRASVRNGVLEAYITPTDGADPGKLMLITDYLTGNETGLTGAFIGNVLGISTNGSPLSSLDFDPGHKVLSETPDRLPLLTAASSAAAGIGLSPLEDAATESSALGLAEILYRMEFCSRCYGNRGPYDPIMAVRRPALALDPIARVIGISMKLEYFDRDQTLDALNVLLDIEMGVPTP